MQTSGAFACHALGTLPRRDESLAGFVFRLAGRRGMADGRMLAEQAGFEKVRNVVGIDDWSRLVALGAIAGVEWKDLLGISFYVCARRRMTFGATPMHQAFLSGPLSGRRVCPECLAEEPYHRAAWHLSFCWVCPVHLRFLVATCPECGRPLRWRGGDLTRCGCNGLDLLSTPADTVDEGALDGLRAALGLLGDERFATQAAEARGLAPLRDLPDAAAIEFIYGFGMDLTSGRLRQPFSLRPGANPDETSHVALSRGLDACRRWPDSLLSGPDDVEAVRGPANFNVRRHWPASIACWLDGLPEGAGVEIGRTLAKIRKSDLWLVRRGGSNNWQRTVKTNVQETPSTEADVQRTAARMQAFASLASLDPRNQR